MNKSLQYTEAMHAVLVTDGLTNSAKLEILDTLMQDKRMAEVLEQHNAEKATRDA